MKRIKRVINQYRKRKNIDDNNIEKRITEIYTMVEHCLDINDDDTALYMLSSLRELLIEKLEISMSKLSTYKLQKSGISPTTLNKFKKDVSSLQIDTLANLYAKISNIEKQN